MLYIREVNKDERILIFISNGWNFWSALIEMEVEMAQQLFLW
jgi:predicted Rossmann-fold nucleotide-binding protein